ncbi:putative ribonuclease H-like domain-containing protein [Tanacetum coccineum]
MSFISSSNTRSGKSKVPTVQGFSTTSGQVSTANTDIAAASLSYDTIDDDDIEEMDIKWNLALLSMRADRFWKKTGKKITIQGSDVAGFDKSKVECFNFHKMGHFAKECRSPRSQDKGKRESYKRDPKVEEPASKAMIAIDGIGWDWSYMAEEDEASNHALVADEEEVPTEYALMAKSSSSSDNEVYDDSFCSKSCRKNTENLNNKIIKLNEELSDCETDLYNYKRGLSQVEARLVEFKENEIKFCERIRVLERDIEFRDNKIEYLRNELEELKKEKESIDFKIEKFENASKDLDKLLGNQKLDKDKKGLGFNEYSVVPPPPAQVYSPPKKDLSWMGLPEFVDDTVTDYSRPTPSIDVSKDVSDEQKAIWKSNSASFSEQGGSVGNVVSKPMIRFVKETGCPSVSKVNNTEKSRKPTVKYAEMYRTKKVDENLHVDFLENQPIEKGTGPNWLFDIDTLTKSMNYVPVVVAGTPSTNFLGTKEDANQAMKENVSSLRFIALPNWFHEAQMATSNDSTRHSDVFSKKDGPQKEQDRIISDTDVSESSRITNPTAITKDPTADQVEPVLSSTVETEVPTEAPSLGNVMSFENRLEDFFGDTTDSASLDKVEADLSNMDTDIQISPTPTLRIHKVHPKSQIIGPIDTHVQTRQKTKNMEEQSFIAIIHQKTNPDLLQYCLFSCFLSQEEPKKIVDALKDLSWVEAMQEELLQFKIQNVWVLVDYPKGVRPIGTKWVLKNKRDERRIVIRNKAKLVAQGHTQEEGIDYEEVFAPVARIDAIRLFLAYASYIGFTLYQMDVKSAFLYETIDEEHIELGMVLCPNICWIMAFKELCREFEALMHDKFKMSVMGELNFFLGLQVLQKKDGIFLSQDKYVVDILKKFGFSYIRSMIGSLMYLTASRPDIMFAVCACARHQVTPKECHLYDVKRIFRYLKGHSKLGLWYPKESPFDLVAYSDSDYSGATQDRKSTTGEYVAAASGCGQVLLIQNQLLNYGYNFMNAKIYIDNNSAICIVKNPVYYSKTKHIEIRHHFIRDCYEKKLINVDHMHTYDNVADLLTKAFDVGRF